MRIVNRQTFLKLPAGVLYAVYQKTGDFGTLSVKDDTSFGFDGSAIDFFYQNCMEIEADGSEEWLKVLTDAEDNGSSFNLDLNCGSRDGLFDDDMLFAVFEQADLDSLRTLLLTCVPACIDAKASSITEVKVGAHKQMTQAEALERLEPMLEAAPRCSYNYEPASGRRPCTINVERDNKVLFGASNLPHCPFVDACFTRTDCLFLTSRNTSELEAEEQVAKELRQLDWRVEKLTNENTQTLRPYL